MGGERTITVEALAPFFYGKGLPERDRNTSGTTPVYGSNGIVGYHDKSLTNGPTVIVGRKGTVGAIHYSAIPCWPIDTTFFYSGTDKDLVRFRYFALKTLGLEDMNTDSAVPGLNRDAAHARVLPDFSEDEQRAIAHILGTLDDKIELNRRMNETLEAIARAMFKSWFVDFDPVRAKASGEPLESICRRLRLTPDLLALFPDRLVDSELGKIPEGWEVKRVSNFMELAYGKALKASDRIDGSVPVYGSGGITGLHNGHLVDGPGIIIGRKGTVGSLYWEDQPFYPIDTVFFVVPKIQLTYCYYVLQTLGLERMNTDAAVPGLNRSNVYRLPVALSPHELRQEFDRQVKPLRDHMFANNQELTTLADIRDTLLPQLLSGELRVPDEGEA